MIVFQSKFLLLIVFILFSHVLFLLFLSCFTPSFVLLLFLMFFLFSLLFSLVFLCLLSPFVLVCFILI